MRTDDLRINRIRPLIAPVIIAEDIPLTDAASAVAGGRRALEATLDVRDPRLAVIVGSCSIQDPAAAVEYAQRLKPLALLAAASSHLFPSLTKEGAPAILETTGDPYCHVVLRGGADTGPNFGAEAVGNAVRLLAKAHLPQRLMIESHLVGGRQDLFAAPLLYCQSITDACLGFAQTQALIHHLADAATPG